MLALLLLASPCVKALPVDSGEIAPCSGIIITTEQAKQMMIDRRELKARREIECPPVPPCPACPKSKPPTISRWLLTGAAAGIATTLALTLALR